MSAELSAHEAAAEVLNAAQRLSAVLEQENRALKRRDAETVRSLLEDKLAALDAYERAVKTAASLSAGFEDEIRSRLKIASASIATLGSDNQRLLQVARTASKRLVEHIVDAVRQQAPGAATYARNGAFRASGRARSAAPAISFNGAF